jgi:hypothetical protein
LTVSLPQTVAGKGIYLAETDTNYISGVQTFYGGAGSTAVTFDYTTNNVWPASTSFYNIDVGGVTTQFANVGTPFAAFPPNVENWIYGLAEGNTGTAPNLANLNVLAPDQMVTKPFSFDPSGNFIFTGTGTFTQATTVTGIFASFGTVTNGQSGIAVAVEPPVGAINDQVSYSAKFTTNTGVPYAGGQFKWTQTTATNGSQATNFAISVETAGSLGDILTGTAASLFPSSDNTMSLGLTATRFSELFGYLVGLKPQAFASLPTCNAGNDGVLAFVNNADSITNNSATAHTTGTHHVLAVCTSSQWTTMGGV